MRLKRLSLILICLTVFSSPSFGEWKEVEQNYFGVYFIETDTIRRNGDTVYFNMLKDFFKPQNQNRVLSEWSRESINCKTKVSTTFLVRLHSYSMGKGEVVVEFDYSDDPLKIQNGSLFDRISKTICSSTSQ